MKFVSKYLARLAALIVCAGAARAVAAQSGAAEPPMSRTIIVGDAVVSLAYSRDGRLLAGASSNGIVRVWDAETGALVRTLQTTAGPVSVAYSARWLAALTWADSTVRVWDAASGALSRTFTVRSFGWSLAYSPDGRWLATASDSVRVWDSESGALVRTFSGRSGDVRYLTYSPDGRRLAASARDTTVRVWDAVSGELVNTLKGHLRVIGSLAYSRDGRWLASASADGTVRVWEGESGALVRTLQGHPAGVSSVAYSPDGRWLLGGGPDGVVIVWNALSGRLERNFGGHGANVFAVAFSGDGRRLAYGTGDLTVRLHEVDDRGIHAEDEDEMWIYEPRRELAQMGAPKDEFESDAEFESRREAAYELATAILDSLRTARVAEVRAITEQREAIRESRIIASRRPVTLPSVVTLDRYDANAGLYPMTVAGVNVSIAMPPEEARLLSQNRDRIVVEAVEQLSTNLRDTTRLNMQLIHPVNGKRYPIGTQIAIEADTSRVQVRRPAALAILEPRFTDTDGDNRLGPGERAVLEFLVRNTGQGPAQGVRVAGSSAAPIDGLNATLGTVAAGETRTVSLTLVGRNEVRDTTVTLRFEVREVNGFDAPPLEVRVSTRAFRPPVLQVADVGVEDADGRAEIRSGRVVTLTIRVRNGGEGRAEGVVAEIAAGANVFLVDDTDNRRVTRRVGDLAPGTHRDVTVQAFANTQAGLSFPVTVTLREQSGRFTAAARELGLTQQATLRSVAQLEVAARESAPATGAAASAPALVSDLLPIPMARKRNRHAIAVIIGNRSYRNAPGVAFAANDAAVMRQYAERALGVEPGNIVELNDATGTELNATFGVRGNPNGRLRDLVTPDSSEVFVFYSGHGAPDARAQKAYLMPVDADANRLDLTAYSVDVLYENLAALGAKHVTVVMDACFSGATGGGEMLITAASPIGIQVNDPSAKFAQGSRATIIAAAQGQELANWYPEQRHGLLTYYFLKGLQGSADADGDGTVTVGEMRTWLTNPASGVPSQSRRLFGINRQQTPQVWGDAGRIIR